MADPPVGKNEKCLLNGWNLVWTNFDHSNLFQSLIPYFKNQQKKQHSANTRRRLKSKFSMTCVYKEYI